MASVANHLPLCKHRYVLFVSYLGTRYNGSQRLVARDKDGNQDSIQEALECSVEGIISKKRCRLTTASRTDKGVHAFMNCYSLPLMDYRTPTEMMKHYINHNLAKNRHEISVNEVLLAPADFHPRKAAISREYIYRIAVKKIHRQSKITNRHRPSDLIHKLPINEIYKVLPLPSIDLVKANDVMNILRGKHDFASFCLKSDQDEDTTRELEISLYPESFDKLGQPKSSHFDFYNFHFKSRAFLHNQIRRIVGTIIAFATYNQIRIRDIQHMLEKPDFKNWNSRSIIAEPWGLYLSRINYEKSSFQGTIKTNLDNTEEKIESFPGVDEAMSDDENTRDIGPDSI